MPSTQSTEQKYQYASLVRESRDIRLLTLCAGNWNDVIRCMTCVVSLDLHPVYEAVSYAWGNPEDTKPLFLNGYEVFVTRNLESALRHLRKPDQDLSLWADALCIDQKNVDEKTHQVSMMGDIYSACRRVYIWLGTPSTQVSSEGQLVESSSDASGQGEGVPSGWTLWSSTNNDPLQPLL
jgi:hypothetical protein